MKQKGTLFWHAHFSWLRATVYGALIIYPKTGVPYPFKYPYEEHTIILGQSDFHFMHEKKKLKNHNLPYFFSFLKLGEYWSQDLVQLEKNVTASGGGAPVADAYTINGHPGPNYNCSVNGSNPYFSILEQEILF